MRPGYCGDAEGGSDWPLLSGAISTKERRYITLSRTRAISCALVAALRMGEIEDGGVQARRRPAKRARGAAGRGHLLPRRDDGFDDVGVAGAAADLSAQFVADGLRIRARMPLQDVARHDQHARRAEAALQGVALVEMPAQQRHHRIAAQPFERHDRAAVGHDGERQARARRNAVHHHGAGAAGAMLAAEMRRGEPAAVAQEVGQRLTRLHVIVDLHAIQFDGDRCHWARMSRTARRMFAVCIRF